MIKKMIFIILLFVSMINAASLTLNKTTLMANENVSVIFTNMTGKHQDWIGIYPKGSSNAWGNVLAWHWTDDKTNGQVTFNALPIGQYEARAFYNNNFSLKAKKAFRVTGATANPTVRTTKTTYSSNEHIVVNFTNMVAKHQDWIGIYPKGSSNAWDNVITWHWTDDKTNGQVTFNALPTGQYEARAFYNNNFNLKAKKAFIVKRTTTNKPTVTTTKTTYRSNEPIIINFTNMVERDQDWIGIYPKGSSTAWNNVIAWHWTDDKTNGQITFNKLPAGQYEARAFYNNGFHLEAKKTFSVTTAHTVVDRILIDDAEDGIDPRWKNYAGAPMRLLNQGAQGSHHSIRTYTGSGQYIYLGEPSKKFKYLTLDVRVGVSSHNGNFSVYVKTKNGNRRIVWSVYLNHLYGKGHPADPFISGDKDNVVLNNPAPTDYFFETKGKQKFVHYKINVEQVLKILEPNNKLLSIQLFTTAGGDFDNIALLSQ